MHGTMEPSPDAASPTPSSSPAVRAKRLFLIDGYSNIFRAYYAIRNLSSSKGEPTNAVYGFLQMLRKLLREEQPELVGVALDVGEKTLRSERYVDYKANRAPMPEDLRPQIPWIRKVLDAYGIPILELEGYEADDVLGTLAAKAAAAGYEVVLVSADKDLMQLVAPGVSLFHTGRNKLYTPELVEEDFGLPPEQVVDVLALMGDAVDNVPGVPGIGEKGAKALIREYGSLEALLERAAQVQRKSYREGLEEHREQALLSRELVTIHTDLDIELHPEALRHDPPDPEALREIFSRLEFFSLLEEIGKASTAEHPPASELATVEEVETRLAGFGSVVSVVCLGPRAPRGLALADGSQEPLWVDLRREGVRGAALAFLSRWAGDPQRRLLGHDLKEVLRLCPELGEVRCALDDVMLHAYLVNPGLKGTSLEELALEALQHQAISWAEAGWGKGQEPSLGDPRLLAAAGERLALLARLEQHLAPQLEGGNLRRVYEEIERPLIEVLLAMEEHGVLLDVPFLSRMSEELGAELARLEGEIHALAGEPFNIASPRQLGEILFEKLEYPVLKRTRKTKSYSTDAETLEELALRGFPLPERLLRHRELAKLKSTYVDAFPALVAADGRLHTRYHQAVAATGRLSSADPNLQNIPIRTELGQRVRRAFVAPAGHVLLAADYSQVELRILAHIAGEETLIEAFRQGRDVHAATASAVFGVAPELVTSEQRRAAKVINFGIIYGMSAFGLGKNLRIPPKEAERFIAAYMERYPGVRRYTEETVARAEAQGKVETLYGRIRPLPEIHSKSHPVRENARRMAINARIQGTAADLLKLAMVAVHRRLRREHPDAHLILTVHDELVLEVPEADAAAVGALVREEMEGVAELAVPLAVETGWGPSWGEAKR
jgi:DNA polymerase I